jgi:hypothetical protein
LGSYCGFGVVVFVDGDPMSLDTYADLQAALSDYLDDETLDARIPDFIRLFEVKAQRILRTSKSKNVATAQTDGNGQVALPDDFRGVVRLTLSDGTPLDFLTPDDVGKRNSYANNRSTYAYTIEGRTLTIVPASSVIIVLYYYQGIEPLTVSNTWNWMLLENPDAYLYGALAEAEAFGFNDARLATWRALASDSLAQVIGSDFGSEWANAATVVPDPVW